MKADVWIGASDGVGELDAGDHAREDEEEERSELEPSSEYCAGLGVGVVLRREDPLHDHLVRTPVPEDWGESEKAVRSEECVSTRCC